MIVTKYIYQNETFSDRTTPNEGVLAYFHNETNCTNDDHYMKLPAIEKDGNCVLNNYTFQRIDFGENSRITCNVVLNLNDLNETDTSFDQPNQPTKLEQNNTYICRSFQKKIMEFLLPHFELQAPNSTVYSKFNLYISEMGNPKNDSKYWHNFQTVRPPNLDEIVAVGGKNGGLEFTCMNMVLGLRYEFFYGYTLIGKISNQPMLKVAQIQFDNRLDLKFKLDEDELKVPLYIDVMFYDFSRVVGNGATQYNIQNLLFLVIAALITLIKLSF